MLACLGEQTMRTYLSFLFVAFFVLSTEVSSMTLLDAYNSPRYSRRRQGLLNTRFTPIAYQEGTDDWQQQLGQARLVDKIMDENGVTYEVAGTINDRVSTYFNANNPRRSGINI